MHDPRDLAPRPHQGDVHQFVYNISSLFNNKLLPISFCSSIEHYDLLQIHSCSLEKNTLSHRQTFKDLKDTVVPQSYHETREMAQPIKGSSCKHEGVINPECSLRAWYSSVCSAGARDWPASLAISELQVWREAPHLKIRRQFTRDFSTSSYHLPVAPHLGSFVPLSLVHAGVLCGVS